MMTSPSTTRGMSTRVIFMTLHFCCFLCNILTCMKYEYLICRKKSHSPTPPAPMLGKFKSRLINVYLYQNIFSFIINYFINSLFPMQRVQIVLVLSKA